MFLINDLLLINFFLKTLLSSESIEKRIFLGKQNLNFIAITTNNDIIINISKHPIINLFEPVQPKMPPD